MLVVDLASVNRHEQRSLLVGSAHEVDSRLRAHVLHKLAGHPRRERLRAGKRVDVDGGVTEREVKAQAHNLVQHGIGHASSRARAKRLHQLDALVNGGVRLFAQENKLVGGNLQGIARLAEHVLGSIKSAVDDFVKRATSAHGAKRE